MVAWDLDNTLFDRDAAVFRFFQWYLARRGRDTTALLAAIMALDAGGDGDRVAFCRRVDALCGHNPLRADRLWDTLRVKLPEFVQPEKTVAVCLSQLQERYGLALISNGGGPLQRAKMARADVARFFPPEHVFLSGEVGFDKPDSRLFEAALQALGKRPEQVLYVGDHPVNDVAGAAAVGMRTCWVSRGRPVPPDLRADAVVSAPWRLLPLLR